MAPKTNILSGASEEEGSITKKKAQTAVAAPVQQAAPAQQPVANPAAPAN